MVDVASNYAENRLDCYKNVMSRLKSGYEPLVQSVIQLFGKSDAAKTLAMMSFSAMMRSSAWRMLAHKTVQPFSVNL